MFDPRYEVESILNPDYDLNAKIAVLKAVEKQLSKSDELLMMLNYDSEGVMRIHVRTALHNVRERIQRLG